MGLAGWIHQIMAREDGRRKPTDNRLEQRMIDHELPRNSSSKKHSIFHRLTLDLWLAKDNRFLNPKSSYQRILTAPPFRLIRVWCLVWCLVWITLVFSIVLPLVLGLDPWVFSLHLQVFYQSMLWGRAIFRTTKRIFAWRLHPKTRSEGKGMLEVPWLAVELREWFAVRRSTFSAHPQIHSSQLRVPWRSQLILIFYHALLKGKGKVNRCSSRDWIGRAKVRNQGISQSLQSLFSISS